jgi:hypothetical protein
MSPNAGGERSYGVSGSQPMRTAVQCAYGAQINFRDLTPYLSLKQRGLIYTEHKPLGRLYKMCYPFFHEFRGIPSANGFQPGCPSKLVSIRNNRNCFFRFVPKQFVSIVSLLYGKIEFRCFD